VRRFVDDLSVVDPDDRFSDGHGICIAQRDRIVASHDHSIGAGQPDDHGGAHARSDADG
jgi:hypothetical protein